MGKDALLRFLRSVVILAGISSLLIGLVIIIIEGNRSLIGLVEVRHPFIPTQYYAAIGAFLIGASLLAVAFNRAHLAIVGGGYAVALGLPIFLEDILGMDLGVSRIFIDHSFLNQASNLNRMAPNTALCFTLVGIALLLMSRSKRFKYLAPVIGIIGSITTSLSLVALFGYLAKIPTAYTWKYFKPMSFHVASIFCVQGVALIAWASLESRGEKKGMPQWLPIHMGIMIFVVSVLLWQAIVFMFQSQVQQAIDIGKAYSAILIISLFMALLLSFMSYLTQRFWLIKEELYKSEERFRSIAQSAKYAIITINNKGKIVFWNQMAEETFGYREDEAVGKSIDMIVPERLRENQLKEINRMASMAQSTFVGKIIEAYGLRKGDVEFPVELSVSAMTTKEGVFFTAILRDITERKRIEEVFKQNLEKSKEALKETIDLFDSNIEKKDPYLTRHQQGVTYLACAIAQEMNLPEAQIEIVHLASTLHDVGYLYISGDLLSKPEELTPSELEIIKTHPQIGFEIIKSIRSLQPAAKIVFQHHERLDGSGYPSGLSGESILLEARIIAVADVVESMVSPRPYRPALGIDKTLEEISEKKGILYDAQVVDACLRLFKEKGLTLEGKNLYLLFNPLYFVLLNYLLRGPRLPL